MVFFLQHLVIWLDSMSVSLSSWEILLSNCGFTYHYLTSSEISVSFNFPPVFNQSAAGSTENNARFQL